MRHRNSAKLISLLLCVMMVLSGTSAFAADTDAYTSVEPQVSQNEQVDTEESAEAAVGSDDSEEAAEDEDPEVTESVIEDPVSAKEGEETPEEEPETPEEEPGKYTGKKEIKGDYYRQYATVLHADDKIACSSDAVSIEADAKSDKLVFSGAKKAVVGSTIAIDKTFNFDGSKVGRFSIDASSAKGQRVTLGFYLDGGEEPFATRQIVAQRKKSTWEFSKEWTVDVSELDLVGEHTFSIKVLDATDKNPAFAIDWVEFVESSVPVMYFNLDESQGTIGEMNSSDDHSAECYGSVTIKVPETYVSADTGKTPEGGTYELEYIRGRGNSTWMTPRKPYKIKLEKKAGLLGMGKNKHWVLLANYYDNSLLRNKITYWIGQKLGMPYTPDSEPVDVVMNGEYYGSYFLTEQIRVGENRVEIDDLEDTPDATDDITITGGYLLSMYPYGDEPTKKAFTTKHGVEFLIESPEFDGYKNDAQAKYIENYMQSIEDAIYGKDFRNEDGVSYAELMDVRAAALYFWIQEFSMNGDGYGSGSTYLYKPRGDKLYWGPLWDFDYVAWGSTEYNDIYVKGWSHLQDDNNWNGRLYEDPEYVKVLTDTWQEVREVIGEAMKSGGQLDKYADNMKVTARYNFEKWGPSELSWDDYDEDIKAPDLTYDEEIERLRKWSEDRFTWVDKNVAKLEPVDTTITFRLPNGKVVEERTGYIGRRLGELPEIPAKKGYVPAGWEYRFTITLEDFMETYGVETVEELRKEMLREGFDDEDVDELIESFREPIEETAIADSYTEIRENMVLTATYIRESDVVKVSKAYFGRTDYYIENESYGGMFEQTINLDYQLTPFDATFGDVSFSSDNPAVVAVEDGELVVKGNGDAVITLNAPDGVKARTRVHVLSEEQVGKLENPYDDEINIQKRITIKKGQYAKLKYNLPEGPRVYSTDENMYSLNPGIVEVGNAGVIHGLKAGKGVVLYIREGVPSIIKVTVSPKPGAVGTVVTRKGVRYKVTSNTKKYKSVTCIGPAKKSISKAAIPPTIRIGGKKYKVTKIKNSAFKGCKKLKTVQIGSKVEIVGKSAFRNCKNLRTVKIFAKQAKIYSTSFKGTPKKAVFKVKREAKKYYRLVLKGRRVR